MEIECKYCGSKFDRPVQKGKQRLFCGIKCRNSAWNRDNPGRRKEIHQKSDQARVDKRKTWEAENAELLREYRRQHYLANKGKYLAKASARAEQMPETVNGYKAKYAATPVGKDKALETVYRRRARILKSEGHFTRSEFRELIEKYGSRCLCCGQTFPAKALEADHVVALARGGPNDIGNIQPLCQPCNRKKADKTIDYRPQVGSIDEIAVSAAVELKEISG